MSDAMGGRLNSVNENKNSIEHDYNNVFKFLFDEKACSNSMGFDFFRFCGFFFVFFSRLSKKWYQLKNWINFVCPVESASLFFT